MESIKLSVIIPMYNSEKYVKKSIVSLEEQTASNEIYEVVIVNDGSTDNSYAICESLAQKYNNIVLVSQPNGGVSKARNKGIEYAKGKWITFLDSDDYVTNNYVEEILRVSEDYEYVIFDNYIENRAKVSIEKKWIKNFSNTKISKRQATEWICDQRLNAPWDKRFLRSVILKYNLSFDENLCMGEDMLFNLEYVLKVNTVYVSDKALCIHTNNKAGLCNSSINANIVNVLDYVYKKNVELLSTNGMIETIHIVNLSNLRILTAFVRKLLWNRKDGKEALNILKRSTMMQNINSEKIVSIKDRIRKILLKALLATSK